MSSPADAYADGVRTKLKHYYAAWLPNERLQLGDVGVLKNNLFRRITSLGDLGVAFEKRADDDPTPIDITSESSVTMTLKAAGETNDAVPNVPKMEAGIAIEFGSTGSFVVNAPETYEPSIENIAKVEKDILQAFRDGRWDKSWAVIVKLVTAPVASILVSRSSNSKIELSAKGDIAGGSGLSLGNASLSFSMRRQSGDIVNLPGAKNVTPFFQLARIQTRLFGGPTVGLAAANQPLSPMDPVTPATADEQLFLDIIRDSDW